ncbi:copper resistance protein C [Devosia pacifica]|uniref:Copper resistance protein C n=1 Tax=Devosia pacifica TaxID=1335967 RepID=A0A918S0P6_9HYPH|nr:copper resistance protein CopC [Devosia pacifica]GHA18857.1 copper resistance protein C [Devosia pacifica]
MIKRLRLALRWLLVLLPLFVAPQALAHAVLLETYPAQNAVIASQPDVMSLTFNEPVSILSAALITPDGERIELSTDANGQVLQIALPSSDDPGTRVLSWRVVSLDGHPVGGTSIFSVGEVTGAADVRTAGDPWVTLLLWLAKAILYGAVFFGAGGAAFWVTHASDSYQSPRYLKAIIAVGLIAAPLSLGLHGADALAVSLGSLLTLAPWVVGAGTSYGPSAVLLFTALVFAGACAHERIGRVRSWFALGAMILAPLALALSGHASAASPQWLTRPAVFLHAAGVLYWAGALFPLALMLRRKDVMTNNVLATFSKRIPFAVAAILVSGATLAAIQLGSDPTRWWTPYGEVLALKLGLLAVLFVLAVINRFALTNPALSGNATAQTRLRAIIVTEIVLVAIIFGLVALWRFTPPPRALALQPAREIALHIHTDRIMADLTITPGTVGTNDLSIYLMDAEFGPVNPLEVEVAVSAPTLGIESNRVMAELGDDGYWHATGLVMPLAGKWDIDVAVRLTRFELVTLSDRLDVR